MRYERGCSPRSDVRSVITHLENRTQRSRRRNSNNSTVQTKREERSIAALYSQLIHTEIALRVPAAIQVRYKPDTFSCVIGNVRRLHVRDDQIEKSAGVEASQAQAMLLRI